MGVLTDFVVADCARRNRVCDAACPSGEFPGLDANGIDAVKLGKLYAVLRGTEFNSSFMGGDPLATGGDEGPRVMEVPADLVQRLAKLDTKGVAAAAAKWAKVRGILAQVRQLAGPRRSTKVLEELAKLCSKAVPATRRVFSCGCRCSRRSGSAAAGGLVRWQGFALTRIDPPDWATQPDLSITAVTVAEYAAIQKQAAEQIALCRPS